MIFNYENTFKNLDMFDYGIEPVNCSKTVEKLNKLSPNSIFINNVRNRTYSPNTEKLFRNNGNVFTTNPKNRNENRNIKIFNEPTSYSNQTNKHVKFKKKC
jgi:hypothetical protein